MPEGVLGTVAPTRRSETAQQVVEPVPDVPLVESQTFLSLLQAAERQEEQQRLVRRPLTVPSPDVDLVEATKKLPLIHVGLATLAERGCRLAGCLALRIGRHGAVALGPLVSAFDGDSPAVEHWNDIYTLLQTNSSYSPGSISE